MQKVLKDSISAALDRTVEEKQYLVKQLADLMKDERALRLMMECKHKDIAEKDGVFICKDCQWCGWK